MKRALAAAALTATLVTASGAALAASPAAAVAFAGASRAASSGSAATLPLVSLQRASLDRGTLSLASLDHASLDRGAPSFASLDRAAHSLASLERAYFSDRPTRLGQAVADDRATRARVGAFRADASYRTLGAANQPDWMRSVADGASLAALSIPGTHDTLAIHGGGLTQTQEDFGDGGGTLARQLSAGIRMIDIRARVNGGNTLTIHHGAVYQNADFSDVVRVLSDFLAAHPAETVIVRLKQECTGELGSCTDAPGQKSFQDIFDSYVTPVWWRPSVTRSSAAATPTLGQVRGKVVLAVLQSAHGSPIEHYGLAQFASWTDGSSTYIQDDYNVPNIGAIATKRDRVRRFLDATNAGDPSKIYVNFGSGASLFAQPQQVAGGAFGVQGVDPFLLTYLNEGHGLTRTGVLMLDFPGSGLIEKVLSYDEVFRLSVEP
ncbi:phosphatidylinositol-specific phospholipase C [Actinoplanes sp. NPDC049548]|uniref:phosphatidylinositol-specific phospholipase C n=1 Tax=Actinoplanes sp. NPDC049548 TaxID=3155152 RepID=UPI00344811E1